MPQGSILGPLLFLIFINDLPNASQLFVKLFADDTFLCAEHKDPESLFDFVNSELNKVYEWLQANELTLNIAKSKFMIITNKRNIPRNIIVRINGIPMEQCSQ